MESEMSKKILVAGDVMLDVYYMGSINRISPEAPVPVFKKESEKSVLGGAANVAANMVAANEQVAMMSTIGNDAAGKKILELLENQNIDTNLIDVIDKKTITKTRFLAENNQQVLRLDIEDIDGISTEVCSRLLSALNQRINDFDLIILSDYLKGFLTYDFCQGCISIAKSHGVRVLVDVKDPDFLKYKGAFLLKPNRKELNALTKMPVKTINDVVSASASLREQASCDYVLTTCGADGMVLVGNGDSTELNTTSQAVYDVTGAGDTTIAYLSAGIVEGMDIKKAMILANYAAGIQCSKVGTSAVTMAEVNRVMRDKDSTNISKQLSWDEAGKIREKGKKIVFTNGCFDILHIGHIRYLEAAKKLGDILIVGVNTDDSVKRLKGAERPINTENDRVEMLAALDCVDYVVKFGEDTPHELIKKVQPDILVKGGDYKLEDVIGKDVVEARGGKVVILPFVKGKSTTNVIQKIRNEQ